MQDVQELLFNGTRLTCPDHPDQQLDEGITASTEGTFSVVCTARIGEQANCMKSAQWPNRAAYQEALRELREKAN